MITHFQPSVRYDHSFTHFEYILINEESESVTFTQTEYTNFTQT